MARTHRKTHKQMKGLLNANEWKSTSQRGKKTALVSEWDDVRGSYSLSKHHRTTASLLRLAEQD